VVKLELNNLKGDANLENDRSVRDKPSKISIVGGAGRMGSWVARFLKDHGMTVIVCDKREKAAKETAQKLGVIWKPMNIACASSDVVVVCVPMSDVVQVCQEVSGQMKEGSLLIEISSVKSGISDVLSQILPEHIGYVSLHPLFGPEITTLKGQNIVAVKTRNDEHTRRVTAFLQSNGAEVTILDVKDHDYAMAVFQVLHHFLLLSLARAIDLFIPENLMKRKLVTNSLRSTLESEMVLSKNMSIVMEIQKINPFSEEIRGRFVRELQKMLEEDPEVLCREFEEAVKRLSILI